MTNYILEITLQSPLTSAAGEGRVGLVDRDIAFDDLGLPILPGRRLKGLWREAYRDITEAWQQCGESPLPVEQVFGESGQRSGDEDTSIYIANAELEEAPTLKAWLKFLQYQDEDTKTQKLHFDDVVQHYTGVRAQTAIDRWTGSAKEDTLRLTRTLKAKKTDEENLVFRARVHFVKPPEKLLQDALALGAVALQYMGTSRTRGLGKISCRLLTLDAHGASRDLTPDLNQPTLPSITGAFPSSGSRSTSNSAMPIPCSTLGTPSYWVIAPMKVAKNKLENKLFAAAWEYDRRHGTIAIGECCDHVITLQDISQFANAEDFQAEISKHELNWGPVAPKMIWDFHRNIQVGDTIVARNGLSEILGIGTVTKAAYYDLTRGVERIGVASPPLKEFQSYIKPRFLEVFWAITGNFSVKLDKLGLKRNRMVQNITESQYQKAQVMLRETLKNTSNPNRGEAIKIETETAHQSSQPEHKQIRTQKSKSSGLSKPNYHIGIDLGTTNSVMAWGSVNPRTNQLEPKIVPINMMTKYYGMQKKKLLPSCVYFEGDQPPNVGEYAKAMLEVQPDQVVESIKHQIGTQEEFEFDGLLYTPTQILALILIHLAASAKSHLGFLPNNPVITVPTYFNAKMRNETIEAARLAGFTDDNGKSNAILLNEPYAVLYDQINQEIRGEVETSLSKSEKPKIVLIFDLGGGALEVSLHRVSYEKKQDILHIDPIARSYNIQVGGDSFDELLANHFYNTYRKKFKFYLDDFQTDLLRNVFRQYAEQAKISFSKQIEFEKKRGKDLDPNLPSTNFKIPTIIRKPFYDKEFRYEGFSIEKYERIIEPFLASDLTLDDTKHLRDLPKNNIIHPILEVLRKGEDRIDNFSFDQVAVLLNGGMTKLSTIQKRLQTLFRSPSLTTSGDVAIARGAVVFNYDKQRGLKAPRISLNTKTKGRIKIKIVSKKSGISVEKTIAARSDLPITVHFDSPMKVGETSAKLIVAYESDPNSSGNIQMWKQEFQFGRSLKEEDVPISVQMSIDEKGLLTFEGYPKNNPNEKFKKITTIRNSEAKVPVKQESFTQREASRLSHLDTDSEITELTAYFRQLVLTNDLNIRRRILNRIESQKSRIIQGSSAEKFVDPLCTMVSELDNFGKMLAINLLGDLAAVCSDTDCLYKICDVATKLISSEEIKTNGQTYVDSVVKASIETIGKTSVSTAKVPLFDLLNLDETNTIRSTTIHAIGKCCDSVDAIEHLKSIIEPGEDTNQVAINWAVGRIGSREKANPLPIQQLAPVITILREQLEMTYHGDIKRNSVYALAEICDRRRCTSNIISPDTAAEIILQIVDFLITQVRDSLSNWHLLNGKLHAVTLLAIQMIRGIDLSPKQKESLHAIREEN